MELVPVGSWGYMYLMGLLQSKMGPRVRGEGAADAGLQFPLMTSFYCEGG